MATIIAGLEQGGVDVGALVPRIQAAFPDLRFDRAILNDEGDDHAVIVLDETWVFRFPRSAEAASYAVGERRLLARLGPISPIPVPKYERVSAEGDFAGYRMIPGRQLGEALFAGLPREVQERVLDDLGAFLACLHALPIALLAAADGGAGPVKWGGARYARHYLERRREGIATALPGDLLTLTDSFFEAFPGAIDTAPRTLIHDDLTEDHILLAPAGDRLAGVIDFTDAGLGDPAHDFAYLWTYGDQAPARAARRYGTGPTVEAMVARSRWWFALYSINRVWWTVRGARAYDLTGVVRDIRASFDALGL